MSVQQKMTQNEVLSYLCDEQWSNAACCGYLIFACENLGYSSAQTDNILNSMQDVFNRKTVEQAKQKYYK